MTKISDLTALTGAGVDGTADLLPIVDMSAAGAARNKKITIDEAKIALGVGAAITELDDIPDVNAPTPTNGDVLTWDSTPGEWVSTAPVTGATTLDGLTDVNAPTPGNGEVLTWDSTPGEWVSQALPGAGAFVIGDATDVDTTGAASGNVLTYDGAQWEPVAPASAAFPYSIYEDQKAANTAGGPSVAGSWIARVLNTEVYDGIGLALHADTVTITIATPGVITWTAHGLILNSAVVFTTSGALPTGLTAGTTYYVISAGLTANTFQVSATVGGAAVNTSGTQSGVHTATASALSLVAGTYEIDAEANLTASNRVRTRLRDITNSTTLVLSISSYASATNIGSIAVRCLGRFTLAGTAIVELQYRVETARATDGLGVLTNFSETEVHCRLKLTKIS